MSEIKHVKLEDVIHSANTGLDAIKRAPIVKHDTGIKCLRIQDISQAKKYPNWGYCEVSDKNYQRFSLKENDIIIARTGATVGVNRFIHKNLKAVYNNGLIRLRAKKDICLPKYLYYQLQSYEYWGHINGVALSTSTQPNMRINGLLSFKFDLPDIDDQQKIASTLSAFDDLIENNTRRIAILEEMARLIYREWFVHYRYPGHENDKMVDSGTELGEVPEGWEVRNLLDICELQTGKALKSKQFNEDGIGTKAVRIRDVRTNSSQTYTDEDFEDKYLVNDGDILVGMDGDFHMCRWADGKSVLVQRVARFRPIEGINLSRFFLYWAIQKPIDFFNKTITGTTVAHLGKKHIETIEVVLPPKEIWNKVNQLLDPLYEQELILRKKNKKLKETRDLLLPKLISGKVTVGFFNSK